MTGRTYMPSRQGQNVPPGTQLNNMFEIDQLLTAGGMGEVYRGHNIQTNDPVAIKIVLPEFAQDEMILQLFRKEARVLNHLHHEAIVRYYVFSIDAASGLPFLAMEFVDGPSLAERIRDGPIDTPSVVMLQRRLADGLQKAHEGGVIHRDIAPDNIILPEGRVDRAKIIDFGIARSAAVGGGTLLGGAFAGKYGYVSPEQLGLFGGEVTHRSDIYSLGLVLAACARGRPLDMSGSQVEVIEKRRVVPDLSGIDAPLIDLFEAMLQPNPDDRPQSMAEVAAWPTLGPEPKTELWRTTTKHPTRPPRSRGTTPPSNPPAGGQSLPPAAPPASHHPAVGHPASGDPGGQPTGYPTSLPPTQQPVEQPAAYPTNPPQTHPPQTHPPQTHPPQTHPPQTHPPQTAYPSQPPTGYPSQPPAGYPSQPPTSYPSHPAAGYPTHPPATGYPTRPQTGYPSQPPTGYPTHPPAMPADWAAREPSVRPRTPAPTGAASRTAGRRTPWAERKKSRPGLIVLGLFLAAGLVGGVGGWAYVEYWSDGWYQLAGPPAGEAVVAGGETATGETQGAAGETAAGETQGAAGESDPPAYTTADILQFVTDFDGGSCFYAHAAAVGDKQAEIIGYGNRRQPFDRLNSSFQQRFDFEPVIEFREVSQTQCVVLEALDALTNAGASRPQLELTKSIVYSGNNLSGTIAALDGRHAAVLMVDDSGTVYNLAEYVDAQGDAASFETPPLLITGPTHFAPQLVITIASPQPLRALDAPGTAAELMPALLDEAADMASSLGVAIDYFKLGS